ncbi:MAG: hypothetical protein NTV39_04505 [Candidatus Saccharibacteria bacterium]|nr:hypothetical protein [Candidatus Saccharibacteria bacterium]
MEIMLVSEPSVLGKVRRIGDIQEALLVFVNDNLGLRGVPEFQELLRDSVSIALEIHVSQIQIGGEPEHLYRDGIKLIVSEAVFSRLKRRVGGVARFGEIIEAAVDVYAHQRDNTS